MIHNLREKHKIKNTKTHQHQYIYIFIHDNIQPLDFSLRSHLKVMMYSEILITKRNFVAVLQAAWTDALITSSCDSCSHPFMTPEIAIICMVDTLNIWFYNFQILLLICRIKYFFFSPVVISFFILRNFLVNRSWNLEEKTKNLAKQSLGDIYGTPYIKK